MALVVKNLPANAAVQSLVWEDPLEDVLTQICSPRLCFTYYLSVLYLSVSISMSINHLYHDYFIQMFQQDQCECP